MHFSGSRLWASARGPVMAPVGQTCDAALAAGAAVGQDAVDDEIAADGRPAAPVDDVLDELVAEVLQRRQHGVGRRLAQPAQRAGLDHPGEALEALEVGELAATGADGVEDADQVPGAHAAGHALAARLGLREAQEVARGVDDAGVAVEDDEPARAHDRARRREVLVLDRRVQELLAQAAARRAAGLHRLEVLGEPAADVVDHRAQRRAERHLDEPGAPHLADQGEGLGALRGLGAVSRHTTRRRGR